MSPCPELGVFLAVQTDGRRHDQTHCMGLSRLDEWVGCQTAARPIILPPPPPSPKGLSNSLPSCHMAHDTGEVGFSTRGGGGGGGLGGGSGKGLKTEPSISYPPPPPKHRGVQARRVLLVRTRPQRGGGRTPPPSTDPNMVVWNNGVCGRRRFCFRHAAGGNFFVRPYVSITQNTENFVENSTMDEKHKKGF